MPATRSPEAPLRVTRQLLRTWPLPPPGGDKYARGVVLVVGGAARTPGAALLAGLAALRVGAGQLRLAVADTAAVPMGLSVPEALVVPLPSDPRTGEIRSEGVAPVLDVLDGVSAVCLGPGLLGDDASADLAGQLMRQVPRGVPVVLDALALGAVREHSSSTRPTGPLILTPNLKEAAGLIGSEGPVEAREAAEFADALARQLDAVVSVLGCTAAPDGRLWVDDTGDEGLATSGSGDVLAGAVTGLLARGAEPAQAAVWATHVHMTAGRLCEERHGKVGFLAREVMGELPRALDAVAQEA